VFLAFHLNRNSEEKKLPRSVVEARHILKRCFSHDKGKGAYSTISFGMPGSCKTALDCSFADYAVKHYPNDKIFWRSVLTVPLQFLKLKCNWCIWIQKDSGVVIYDRINEKDITPSLQKQHKLRYFKDFQDLWQKTKPGVCNAVFFKDLHLKGVDHDEGNILWLRFIDFLNGKHDWVHVFMDEFFELCDAGTKGLLWHEIGKFGRVMGQTRKSYVSLHANAHNQFDVDFRVLNKFMVKIYMRGSWPDKRTRLTDKAIGSLQDPAVMGNAGFWVSEGSNYGRAEVTNHYDMPDGIDWHAVIVGDREHTKICPICEHIFIYGRRDQVFCSDACIRRNYRQKKAKNL